MEAEKQWLLYAQKSSEISSTEIVTDSEGILRCTGRFGFSTNLTYDAKFPIYLPPKGQITKLIILHHHVKAYHVGTQQTLAELRKRFWIPTGRRVVYFTLSSHCANCKKLRNKPYRAPEIPPLPKTRLDPTIPFENTGVDVLGPMYVKFSQQSKKWILICTCLVTRAVHLEILNDMTTEEFLAAFRLFFARRGVPKLLISDNAPQFKLLNNVYELQWMNVVKNPFCNQYFKQQQVEWKWIPQLAPWAGGVYERLVALVKECMRKTFHKVTLTERQLQVATAEIEAVINSRPLNYVGPNICDDVITPNHFLRAYFPGLPEASNAIPKTPTGAVVLEAWKKADAHLNRFWEIFYGQYIAALRERVSTLKQRRIKTEATPNQGDIVMLADDGVKRGQWKLGEIIETEISADGKIRSAKVRLANGETTRRPILKLIPLETRLEISSPPEEEDDDEIVEITCEEIVSEDE